MGTKVAGTGGMEFEEEEDKLVLVHGFTFGRLRQLR
jgi:hypothetical protein